MFKKSDIAGIIKIGLILFAITGVAAFILGAVNNVTEPIITKNNEKKQELAMQKVIPDAQFTLNEDIEIEDDTVSEIYTAKSGEEEVGYAVIVKPMGYNGEISMVVGVDTEGKVTGVDITEQSETAGLGANCVKDEFKNQFIGKTEGISVAKTGATDNQIDAITSATITSRAVTKGVNSAIDAVLKAREDVK